MADPINPSGVTRAHLDKASEEKRIVAQALLTHAANKRFVGGPEAGPHVTEEDKAAALKEAEVLEAHARKTLGLKARR